MKPRREFIGLAAAAAAWPLLALAQQPAKLRVVGFLGPNRREDATEWVAAFTRRLGELGWIEGQTMRIDYRWVEGRSERFAEIASEFAQHKVDVVVTSGTPAVSALKRASSVMPIVFATAGDPVKTGLVAGLARPGGNATGLATLGDDVAGKRLELLRAVKPNFTRLAIMGNVTNAFTVLEIGDVRSAASKLGIETATLEIRRAQDIADALAAIKGRTEVLYVCTDAALIHTHRIQINMAATSARLATMHGAKTYLEGGGLMSYGPNFPDLFRRSADYVDKILRGAQPKDLPVQQPTKFDLVLNIATAKAIGLAIPTPVLVRADEVIQ